MPDPGRKTRDRRVSLKPCAASCSGHRDHRAALPAHSPAPAEQPTNPSPTGTGPCQAAHDYCNRAKGNSPKVTDWRHPDMWSLPVAAQLAIPNTYLGAHNSVVGADQGLRAPSWDLMCRILYRFGRVAGTAGGAQRAPTASSTNTEEPHDQLQHHLGHPQAPLGGLASTRQRADRDHRRAACTGASRSGVAGVLGGLRAGRVPCGTTRRCAVSSRCPQLRSCCRSSAPPVLLSS